MYIHYRYLNAFLMICVAMLFSACKQEVETIKYPEGTLRISCKVYDEDGNLQPFPGARVYFYDFNPFRKEDHFTETMSGFDLATSQLDLGNRYLKYTQMGIADTNGEITMSNVGYGRHWIVGTNIDKNNPAREIGYLIKGLLIDSPENEAHFFGRDNSIFQYFSGLPSMEDLKNTIVVFRFT